jgi:hypothetical protein
MKSRQSLKFEGYVVYRPLTEDYLNTLVVTDKLTTATYTKSPESSYRFVSLEFASMVCEKIGKASIPVPLYSTKKKYIVAFPAYEIDSN